MTKRLHITCVILVMLTMVGIANVHVQAKSFRSDMLEEMARILNIQGQLEGFEDGNHLIAGPNDRLIKVRVQNQEVTHIGFDIFDETTTSLIKEPISDFIERYWLSLTLPMEEGRSPSQRMIEDEFEFLKGGIKTIDRIQKDSIPNITFERNNKYVVVHWNNEDNCICHLQFTVNHERILGRKMRENDRRLHQEILSCEIDSTLIRYPELSQLETTETDGLYIHRKGFYLIPELCSDRYYVCVDSTTAENNNASVMAQTEEAASVEKTIEESDSEENASEESDSEESDSEESISLSLPNGPRPVFTSNLPNESIINLLSGIDLSSAENIELKLNHKNYEFTSTELNINLRKFINFCLSTLCEPYVGIIGVEDQVADVLLVMVNETVGYNHLLRLKVDLATLSTGQGEITGRINAYLPTSNLENIFSEYK